jgi:hypothetical protein
MQDNRWRLPAVLWRSQRSRHCCRVRMDHPAMPPDMPGMVVCSAWRRSRHCSASTATSISAMFSQLLPTRPRGRHRVDGTRGSGARRLGKVHGVRRRGLKRWGGHRRGGCRGGPVGGRDGEVGAGNRGGDEGDGGDDAGWSHGDLSLLKRDPVGLGHQHRPDQSRQGVERAPRPARIGLGPVAIVNRNEHGFCAATAAGPSCGTRQDTLKTEH